MVRHVLVQTFNNNVPPQTLILAQNDDIDTGPMSDCVSVVILYGLGGQGGAQRYQSAVGQHGGGGMGNVNLNAVMAVPPAQGRAALPVFIVTGHNYVDEDFNSMNNTAVRAAKQQLTLAGYRLIRIHYGWSGAIINNRAVCTKYP
jgi:hypothetical protein